MFPIHGNVPKQNHDKFHYRWIFALGIVSPIFLSRMNLTWVFLLCLSSLVSWKWIEDPWRRRQTSTKPSRKNIVKISRVSEFQRPVNSFHCDGPYRGNYARGTRIVRCPGPSHFIFVAFAAIITILPPGSKEYIFFFFDSVRLPSKAWILRPLTRRENRCANSLF